LYDSAYWSGLLSWMKDRLVGAGNIAPTDVDLLHVTDDIEEIVDIIERFEANRYRAAE
jgi:predicted Rossmann-fold nucleotide-binding protein